MNLHKITYNEESMLFDVHSLSSEKVIGSWSVKWCTIPTWQRTKCYIGGVKYEQEMQFSVWLDRKTGRLPNGMDVNQQF